jgi:galactokinase
VSIYDSLVAAGMSEEQAVKKAACFASLEQQMPATGHHQPMRWFVPGRIEVLGKHTDYAGGRSLLCTTEHGFCIAALPRADSLVRIHDIVRDRVLEILLSPDLEIPSEGWSLYPSVVARRIAQNFPGATAGADIVLGSDLPSAAGMSSSSALVVAIFATLSTVNHLDDRPEYRENLCSVEDLAGYLGCIEMGRPTRRLSVMPASALSAAARTIPPSLPANPHILSNTRSVPCASNARSQCPTTVPSSSE